MHGIVEMIRRARENESEFGLLNANGWYLTKHSMGIYSCQVPEKDWQPSKIQSTKQASIDLLEVASGPAKMETFTVIFDKNNQAKESVVIARLESGERCLATTSSDQATLLSLMSADEFAIHGELDNTNGKNVFRF